MTDKDAVTLVPGQQRWHSTEEDGGPDVGIEIGLPDGSMLWAGEISQALHETTGDDGSDGGWWLVHWKANGNPSVIGRVTQSWLDFGGVDDLCAALRQPVANKDAVTLAEELERLIEAARGCEFDLVPSDGPIARIALFMHENGDRILAALRQPATERADVAEAFLEVREFLGLLEQAVCDWSCPAKWQTDEGQPHSKLHEDLRALLAKTEAARDAALKPAEPAADLRRAHLAEVRSRMTKGEHECVAAEPAAEVDGLVERALHARVPGGAEVWCWLPQKDAWTPSETARDVMKAALLATYPDLTRLQAENARLEALLGEAREGLEQIANGALPCTTARTFLAALGGSDA